MNPRGRYSIHTLSHLNRSGRADAVHVHQILFHQHAHDTNALFDMIDGHAMQFQPIAGARIPPKGEAPAVTNQHAGFINAVSDRHHAE